MMRIRTLPFVLAAAVCLAAPVAAQDRNFHLPIPVIEHLLAEQPFEIAARRDTRFEGDRTQRVVLIFGDTTPLPAKWARAPRGGEDFNNEPRYELAAYLLQKMFLDERDYVVPPTVLRSMPVEWYREFDAAVTPTFERTNSTLVVLTYWLDEVTHSDVYDVARLEADTVYARHFANFNLLTHLINHSDSNAGNALISRDSTNPRVFAVDNGVAFRSPPSDRGTFWTDLRVNRLPAETVEHLRRITREDLERALAVVAQFRIVDGELVPMERGEPLNRGRGVRRSGEIVQFGLTSLEIRDVHTRLQRLLRRVDGGRVTTF